MEDTENWRRELARIGEMVGLVTTDEIVEIENRKASPAPIPLSANGKSTSTSGQYSIQSGRWNETPKSANRCRSARRRTPMKPSVPDQLYCVDEQEREMWVRDRKTNCECFRFLSEMFFVCSDASSALSNITNGESQ